MTADRFSRNVAISLALHLGVVLLIFFRAVMVPTDTIDLRDSIRVDIVALPKKMDPSVQPGPPPATVETPSKVQEPEKIKELPKKVETTPVKTVAPTVAKPEATKKSLEKTQSHAIDKIKAMSALDKIKQDLAKEKAAAAAAKAKAESKTQPVAGNQVNAGNSPTGLERIDYDRYMSELKGKVFEQFNLPPWLQELDLKAQILILIDERGYVIKRTLRVSSGNEIFDAKALEAIDNSSPFPPPPQRLKGLLATSGITFRFPQ